MANKKNVPALNDEDILSMPRKSIRYAIFRCKGSPSVELSPTKEHTSILRYYQTQLDDFGFDENDFAELGGWDVSKLDTTEIVTGKTVKKYLDQLNAKIEGKSAIRRVQ